MERNKYLHIRNWKIEEEGGGGADSNLIKVRDIKTAEATKLFEIVYREVNIALANELSLFCEKIGIDYLESVEAANTQPHCHFLLPSIVHGQTSNEVSLLVEEAENVNVRLLMTELARKINEGMLRHTLYLVRDAMKQCGKTLRGTKISILGLGRRPDVKDARGSSTKDLVQMLRKRGVKVSVYDSLFSYKELRDLGYPAERTLTKTVEGADCLVIATGHEKFKRLNLRKIKLLVKKPAVIVDTCRVIGPGRAEREGFLYLGVGRGFKPE